MAFPSYHKDVFTVVTDPSKLDVVAIHRYLTRAYWSEGIPQHIVEKALANSLCFGLFQGTQQIGLARVVTDRATYAYLCDVYVLEEFRGKGLGVWLMKCVTSHPDLQGLRRFSLATRDAHGLYEKFGFAALKKPQSLMEIVHHDIYLRSQT
ncbi:MAG TPA: GNAT family N-acetyltransferase [Candidatus Acidoferrales bacterium]|nr:GNAT family N-acetyltransferase [Candidatus Acidoferrales bacterium]